MFHFYSIKVSHDFLNNRPFSSEPFILLGCMGLSENDIVVCCYIYQMTILESSIKTLFVPNFPSFDTFSCLIGPERLKCSKASYLMSQLSVAIHSWNEH
jgi:hypothetical protein